jgi:hypothetical protein
MIAACGRHWFREYAGLGKSLNTFAVSFAIVAVYSTILVTWFWHLIAVSAVRTELEAASCSLAFTRPGSFPRPIEGGHSPTKAVILTQQEICKNLIEVLAY